MQFNKGSTADRDRSIRGGIFGAVAGIVGWCCAAASIAQTAPPPDSRQADQLGEVVVTARKQSERLQDVPLSITALTAETLTNSGALTIQDIGREVPGLNVVSVAPGQNQLIIRGVSSAGGIPTVGYYIDDTPIESIGNVAGAAMDPALFDLARVEVLRGPQGTLYGASSMGGTVKYVTQQPDLTAVQSSVKSSVSDTDGGGVNYEFSGMLNAPLISGLAALRANLFYRYQDGYIDRYTIDPNNYLAALPGGPVTKDANTEKTYGARISIKIQPSEALSITPSVWFQRTNLGAPFTIDDPPGGFSDLIQTRDVSEPSSDQLQLYSLSVNGTAGPVEITSSTSYRNRYFVATEDDSKTNFYYFNPEPQTYVYPLPFWNVFGNHDFTEELRATASAGIVHGLLGLFYLHQDNMNNYNFPVPAGYNTAFGTPFGSMPFYMGNDSNQITQRAVFGEINVDVTSQLQATVGLRAFDITQEDTSSYNGVFNGGATASSGSAKDSGTTPKYELSYHFSSGTLAYASASKGFRQGGPLTGYPATLCDNDLKAIGLNGFPSSFKADTLWNYEIGAKTDWLDNSLTINGAVYYIDWSNVQQLVDLPICGFVFTGNFGKASSKGSELEIQYKPVSALRMTLGLAYNEAKLTSTVAGAQGTSGDTLENAPRWMGSASVEYDREIAAQTSGFARVDFNTSTRQFNNFVPTSNYYERAGYSLANARIGAKWQKWQASLFVNNAFNRHAETALPTSYAIDLPTTRRLSINQPRTIGLDFRLDY
jgi:outer membrane receptor protein involved in Fe transport